MPRPVTPLSKEEVAQLKDFIKRGMNLSEMGEELGIANQYIKQRLLKANLYETYKELKQKTKEYQDLVIPDVPVKRKFKCHRCKKPVIKLVPPETRGLKFFCEPCHDYFSSGAQHG